MQVLLVSADEGYASDIVAAADTVGMDITVVDANRRVAAFALRIGAEAVVFDAEDEFAAVAGRARAFALRHPDVVVGIVAKGVPDRYRDLLVQHRWRAPERLLDALVSARRRRELHRLPLSVG